MRERQPAWHRTPFSNGASNVDLTVANDFESPAKTTGMRKVQFACPPPPDLKRFFRYSFCPVLGFKNSVPLFLILLKLNIWVMELASASNEPWPMRSTPSQLSSTKRMMFGHAEFSVSSNCPAQGIGLPRGEKQQEH
jgi:hypothetical protein